jgi:hypothetical protein
MEPRSNSQSALPAIPPAEHISGNDDHEIIALLRLLYVTLIVLGGLLLGDLLLALWGASVAAGLLHRLAGVGPSGLLLRLAWSIGASMTISAMVSVGLWGLLGGWGPPAFLPLAACGLLTGIVLGLAQHARALAR